MKNEEGIELNSRGIPARKKKKNSLIYGVDDLVVYQSSLQRKELHRNQQENQKSQKKR